MPDKYLYEYAVIRVLPRVEREEFLNVGIIMFSKNARFIKAAYILPEEKLRLFSSELEMDAIREGLEVFGKICSGDPDGGKIATYDIPERFRWLTAIRSTSIQTSRPSSGFSFNPEETFEKLFQELVL